MPGEMSARRRGVLLVLVATVLWSMAGLFARLLAHLDIWTVMCWRALLGAVSIAAVGLIGRVDLVEGLRQFGLARGMGRRRRG